VVVVVVVVAVLVVVAAVAVAVGSIQGLAMTTVTAETRRPTTTSRSEVLGLRAAVESRAALLSP
jgi:hypothetical protein